MNKNSRKFIDTSVYSLDGNDIYEVALAFERLAIQELNRNPEFIYQGNNISSYEKDGYDFKISMDKLISLVKEFYVKVVSRNQGLTDFTSSELKDYLDSIIAEKLENIPPGDVKRAQKLMDKMNNEPMTEEGAMARMKAVQVEIDNIKTNKAKKGFIDNYVRLILIVEPAMKRFIEIRNELFLNENDDEETVQQQEIFLGAEAVIDDNGGEEEEEQNLGAEETKGSEKDEEVDEGDEGDMDEPEVKIDIEAFLKEIQDDITEKKDPSIIESKIITLQEELKKNVAITGPMRLIIADLLKKSKSKTDSAQWRTKVRKQFNEFKQLISKNTSDSQPKDSKPISATVKNAFGFAADAEDSQSEEGSPPGEGAEEKEETQAAEEKQTSGAGYYRGGALGDEDEDFVDATAEQIIAPFEALLSEYNLYRLKLYQESLSSLKEKPIFSKADVILKTSKLQNYEGSASNVLRDILMTTISMTSNIKSNRVNLNAGISADPKLVNSIKTDNDVIMNRFIPVLVVNDEIERYYSEPFDKVLNNLKYINAFVYESFYPRPSRK